MYNIFKYRDKMSKLEMKTNCPVNGLSDKDFWVTDKIKQRFNKLKYEIILTNGKNCNYDKEKTI